MRRWRCGCPICRALAHPLLRLVGSGGAEEVEEGGEEKENPMEKWKEKPFVVVEKVGVEQPPAQEQGGATAQPAPPPPPPAAPTQAAPAAAASAAASRPSSGGGQESGREDEGGSERGEEVRAEVPKEVLERVQQLEEELAKIKNYVKASVDGIKATLVDLRSAIAELSNPFNILRKYADILFGEEESKKEGKKEKEKEEQRPAQPPAPYYPFAPYPVPLLVSASPPGQGAAPPAARAQGAEQRGEAGRAGDGGRREPALRIDDPEVLRGLVLWMNRALERLGSDGVEKLLEGYVKAGLISREAGEALKCVLQVVVKLREAGVPPEEQASIVAGAFSGGEERGSLEEVGGGEEGGGGGEELLKLIEGG